MIIFHNVKTISINIQELLLFFWKNSFDIDILIKNELKDLSIENKVISSTGSVFSRFWNNLIQFMKKYITF